MPVMRILLQVFLYSAFSILMGGSADLSVSKLESLWRQSRAHGGNALLVYQRGRLRFERYRTPASANERQHLMSGAKNFFGLAVFQAAEDGVLDLDEPVADTLTEWRGDVRKQSVKIRQLLQCASGLDPATRTLQSPDLGDKHAAALQVASVRDPGTGFAYGPSHFLILSELLERKLAARGLKTDDYLRERLLEPLGLSLNTWRRDPAGHLIPYAGYSLTAQEWLRFGRMLLSQGRFKGHRLVNATTLQAAFTPSPVNSAYGMTFWLNPCGPDPRSVEADVERWIAETQDWSRACLSHAAPADLVACIGSGGQRLYLVPSRQLVIVHLARDPHFVDSEFLAQIF